jgi:hypothetical protein
MPLLKVTYQHFITMLMEDQNKPTIANKGLVMWMISENQQ